MLSNKLTTLHDSGTLLSYPVELRPCENESKSFAQNLTLNISFNPVLVVMHMCISIFIVEGMLLLSVCCALYLTLFFSRVFLKESLVIDMRVVFFRITS